MRHQLTFWICLILIGAYCFSVSAQESSTTHKACGTGNIHKKEKGI